jgi:hypothetical protein
MKVLILTHDKENCGVFQFGKRVAQLASRSTKVEYIYRVVNSAKEYHQILSEERPHYILYNWYPVTMRWLSDDMIRHYKWVRHYFMFHDGHIRAVYDKYVFFGAFDIVEGLDVHPTPVNIDHSKRVMLPRPLFDYENTYEKNEIPHIGSFGLGGWHKGFPELVTLVGETFDEAVLTIRMPFAFYGDEHGVEAKKIAAKCVEVNTNPDIQLNLTHEFINDLEMLDFLAKNDINVFLYGANHPGLSSVIDYALSVNRPLAITNSAMFRHIIKDEILVEKNSLVEILDRGIAPLEEFYDRWSTDKFVEALDALFI